MCAFAVLLLLCCRAANAADANAGLFGLGLYNKGVGAPDEFTVNANNIDAKKDMCWAAPEAPIDAGRVKPTDAVGGNQAEFEGRSTNFGCYYTVGGVYTGGVPGAGGGNAGTWWADFDDGTNANIVMWVNSRSSSDDNIPFQRTGILNLSLVNGDASRTYSLAPQSGGAGAVTFDPSSVILTTTSPARQITMTGTKIGHVQIGSLVIVDPQSTIPVSVNSAATTVVGVAAVVDAAHPQAIGPVYVPVGKPVTLQAQPDPTGAGWPPLTPSWALTQPSGSTLSLPEPGAITATLTPTIPGDYVLTATCGTSSKSITVKAFKLTLVTPQSGGDPVNHPVDSGDGQNEFTYNTASSGVLTIGMKATVEPSGVASAIASRTTFSVDEISGSTKSWGSGNWNGAAYASGDTLMCWVWFTNLPSSNAAFGAKTAKLKYDGNDVDSVPYEVFYMKNEKNHPRDATNSDWPNWMYYWLQTVTPQGPSGIHWYYAASTYATIGTNDIRLSDGDSVTYGAPYGIHNPLEGIDNFAWKVTHESQHYADYWTCWNNDVARWDNANGKDGPDDDKDRDKIPNRLEDVNLNGVYDAGDLYDWQVKNTPTLGRPVVIVNDFEDWNCQRNKGATGDHSKDWAAPGMQHGTLNKYDD